MITRVTRMARGGLWPMLLELSLAASCVVATAVPASAQRCPAPSNRVIYYYQTEFDRVTGDYISLSPIWTEGDPVAQRPYVTDVMLAAFHLGHDLGTGAPYIHLNNQVPSDPRYDPMWNEVTTLQSTGVKVSMTLGGAARGSYANLFTEWDTFYPILQQTLQYYSLDGIDLDVEESVSLTNIQRLIDQLTTDFGDQFVITLAPVASALWGGATLSGFSYPDLFQSDEGGKIAWFNAQFYSGFATLSSTSDYDRVIAFGNSLYPADRVVAGMLSNPGDGSGFVNIDTAAHTITTLGTKYANFGGVFAWEYYNSLPGGTADPAAWAPIVAKPSLLDEVESLPISDFTSGDVVREFLDTGLSGGAGIILEGLAAGDSLTFTVTIPEARTYDIRVGVKNSNNRGIWQLNADGVDQGPQVDQYAAASVLKEIELGSVTFTSAGDKAFSFTVTDRNASSTGFWIALDYIKLIPQ
jgi:hypothetical protein